MPSIGLLLGLPATLLLLVGAIVVYRKSERLAEWDDSITGAKGYRAGAAIAFVLVLGFSLWSFYPFSWEYHSWTAKTGVVDRVSSRVVTTDESIDQKFVIAYTEDPGQEYGCQDTRCALIQKGDTVTLTCKRVFQLNGYDGWDCQFVSRTPRDRVPAASE